MSCLRHLTSLDSISINIQFVFSIDLCEVFSGSCMPNDNLVSWRPREVASHRTIENFVRNIGPNPRNKGYLYLPFAKSQMQLWSRGIPGSHVDAVLPRPAIILQRLTLLKGSIMATKSNVQAAMSIWAIGFNWAIPRKFHAFLGVFQTTVLVGEYL